MQLNVIRKGPAIYPDSNRVIARYFFPAEERAARLISQVMSMSEEQVHATLHPILREFSNKYRSVTAIYKKNYNNVKHLVKKLKQEGSLSEWRKLLIGAYFTMEYAVESAALFNPSIVEDPDQSGLQQGQVRVIVSLRATGEGHISSLVFRRAVITENNEILLQRPGAHVAEAAVIKNHIYHKETFVSKLNEMGIAPEFYELVLSQLPAEFIYDQIREVVKAMQEREGCLLLEQKKAIEEILWLADSYTEIKFSLDTDLAERVIFPISKFERNGIEDARFVRFKKDTGETVYYGTYTAYDGYTILPKLIETKDFYTFKIFPLHGSNAIGKNMALFPRKINGRYAMISRIDGFRNYLMYSDSLNRWEYARLLQEPVYPWELVQLGNGGSPVETPRGWLMITHGVGPVRKYCLSACLLDLEDPGKIIGRLKEPLLLPFEQESAGYVPNVVYTCGVFVHNGMLIIPYSMSDYASSFATVDLNALLDELTG
ncbi:glycosidase [Niabella ginsenosidivorans]|uniref:Glycosidase n=1 Tax=Niabella ginsenosidivorans TaxID=1176587 RepID=A0A1A9I768_9BACT|nr:glycoside hydrolase family 130 protein [Niabella ginsenosidivorans]ANH82550.1 glycosidase [Niabella ginsenosidivorans]